MSYIVNRKFGVKDLSKRQSIYLSAMLVNGSVQVLHRQVLTLFEDASSWHKQLAKCVIGIENSINVGPVLGAHHVTYNNPVGLFTFEGFDEELWNVQTPGVAKPRHLPSTSPSVERPQKPREGPVEHQEPQSELDISVLRTTNPEVEFESLQKDWEQVTPNRARLEDITLREMQLSPLIDPVVPNPEFDLDIPGIEVQDLFPGIIDVILEHPKEAIDPTTSDGTHLNVPEMEQPDNILVSKPRPHDETPQHPTIPMLKKIKKSKGDTRGNSDVTAVDCIPGGSNVADKAVEDEIQLPLLVEVKSKPGRKRRLYNVEIDNFLQIDRDEMRRMHADFGSTLRVTNAIDDCINIVKVKFLPANQLLCGLQHHQPMSKALSDLVTRHFNTESTESFFDFPTDQPHAKTPDLKATNQRHRLEHLESSVGEVRNLSEGSILTDRSALLPRGDSFYIPGPDVSLKTSATPIVPVEVSAPSPVLVPIPEEVSGGDEFITFPEPPIGVECLPAEPSLTSAIIDFEHPQILSNSPDKLEIVVPKGIQETVLVTGTPLLPRPKRGHRIDNSTEVQPASGTVICGEQENSFYNAGIHTSINRSPGPYAYEHSFIPSEICSPIHPPRDSPNASFVFSPITLLSKWIHDVDDMLPMAWKAADENASFLVLNDLLPENSSRRYVAHVFGSLLELHKRKKVMLSQMVVFGTIYVKEFPVVP